MATDERTPIKRSLTPERRKQELEMMTSPMLWPRWPVLPVKCPMSVGWPKMGVLADSLIHDVLVEPVIYDFSLYGREKLDKSKVVARYNSLEEMIDDGWIVD